MGILMSLITITADVLLGLLLPQMRSPPAQHCVEVVAVSWNSLRVLIPQTPRAPPPLHAWYGSGEAVKHLRKSCRDNRTRDLAYAACNPCGS
eukprot:COSAG01_NODE_4306_length_5147_cov_2.402932_1_plen_91_part_10